MLLCFCVTIGEKMAKGLNPKSPSAEAECSASSDFFMYSPEIRRTVKQYILMYLTLISLIHI